MQLLGNLLADALDASDCLTVKFLGRELDCGVTGMDSCKLDVLGNRIFHHFAILGNGIKLDLFRSLHKLGNNHRILFGYLGSQT